MLFVDYPSFAYHFPLKLIYSPKALNWHFHRLNLYSFYMPMPQRPHCHCSVNGLKSYIYHAHATFAIGPITVFISYIYHMHTVLHLAMLLTHIIHISLTHKFYPLAQLLGPPHVYSTNTLLPPGPVTGLTSSIYHKHTFTPWPSYWAHLIHIPQTHVYPLAQLLGSPHPYTTNTLLPPGSVTGLTYSIYHKHTFTPWLSYSAHIIHKPQRVLIMLIPHTHIGYVVAQSLGSYYTYNPYTQHLLYGPITGLTSYIYNIHITFTPGPITVFTYCVHTIHMPRAQLLCTLPSY